MLLAPCVRLRVFGWVGVAGWPPVGKVAARSACGVFSWYKYLIVSFVFSHLGFWGGGLFLVAPFPGLCLLVLLLSFFQNAARTLVIILVFHSVSLCQQNTMEEAILNSDVKYSV